LDHYLKNVYLHKFRALQVLMDLVADSNPRDILAWHGARELLRDMRQMLVRLHAWAVPNNEAIEVVARYSPLVEVGAGNGYWAWLLQLAGADVVAYDLKPPASSLGDPFADDKPWTEVCQGSVEEALAHHPTRTLFLCWPPADDPMAAIALGLTQAGHVIFVGWQDDDLTGSCEFHQQLRDHWDLVQTVDIPQWPEMRDRLLVYRRR
jgi:hypothetical protein